LNVRPGRITEAGQYKNQPWLPLPLIPSRATISVALECSDQQRYISSRFVFSYITHSNRHIDQTFFFRNIRSLVIASPIKSLQLLRWITAALDSSTSCWGERVAIFSCVQHHRIVAPWRPVTSFTFSCSSFLSSWGQSLPHLG
jgi:hypothetical protein